MLIFTTALAFSIFKIRNTRDGRPLVDFGAMVALLLPPVMYAVYISQVCCLNKLDIGSLDKVHQRSCYAAATLMIFLAATDVSRQS